MEEDPKVSSESENTRLNDEKLEETGKDLLDRMDEVHKKYISEINALGYQLEDIKLKMQEALYGTESVEAKLAESWSIEERLLTLKAALNEVAEEAESKLMEIDEEINQTYSTDSSYEVEAASSGQASPSSSEIRASNEGSDVSSAINGGFISFKFMIAFGVALVSVITAIILAKPYY